MADRTNVATSAADGTGSQPPQCGDMASRAEVELPSGNSVKTGPKFDRGEINV